MSLADPPRRKSKCDHFAPRPRHAALDSSCAHHESEKITPSWLDGKVQLDMTMGYLRAELEKRWPEYTFQFVHGVKRPTGHAASVRRGAGWLVADFRTI